MANYRGQLIPFTELTDMLLILGQYMRQHAVAAREYAQMYPNRIHPGRDYFATLERRARESGSFVPRIEGRGPQVNFRDNFLHLKKKRK